METNHLRDLEASLAACKHNLSQVLDSSTVCAFRSSDDIVSTIRSLKTLWREFSDVSVSLRALRVNSDDVVGAGLLKADRKIMAGSVESVVCLLNQALRDAGNDAESEFANSISSSFSQLSFSAADHAEALPAPADTRSLHQNGSILGNGQRQPSNRQCEARARRLPEHELLRREMATARKLDH